MWGRVRRASAAALLAVGLTAGCATFPDNGPREWQEQIEGAGELGGIPRVPESADPRTPPPSAQQSPQGGPPPEPQPCDDPDPAVVETCLEPVGAVAVLPDGVSALVAERTTGRVLRVERGTDPELVATVAVDASGGGGLTGLVLSPSYAEDRLVYAYATTPEDNRVLLIAEGEPPKPLLTGIPRGASNNGGALGVDVDGSLLVATGDAGGADPASLAGKLLRIDTFGRPAIGNPDPASPVLSSGLTAPGGVCVNPATTAAWVTDRAGTQDVLHLVVPGPLGPPAWTWPDRPGVAGCVAQFDVVAVAQTVATSLFVLRTDPVTTAFTATETQLAGVYGRLAAAAPGPDGLIWLGTVNKDGGVPVPSDDRVVVLPPVASGGQSRA
ncbi:PQQ-dependent sugar dehydrogenase [Pseudonocardia hydrocarbonoxydans]|uniref:Glucose dehydrogenase n=1 Tax=Pseudonocardia hydrocarbonoxydans TaxID=76726 RepID=A0A4Y3WKA3_9PSEU|nr:PQQ-dependent sugar dehydrogenase [Pseudonocardia hydrocarbonoxydans]GEC19195.1 glucose dehydrogenase [Pseudonocardia hydrocarbonoxydans]